MWDAFLFGCGLSFLFFFSSSFEDESALKLYATHPEHVAVADGKVRPYQNQSLSGFCREIE